VYHKLMQFEEAVEDLERALALDPENPIIRALLTAAQTARDGG
jgi:tetratricopeptide (TPR) repeat protein